MRVKLLGKTLQFGLPVAILGAARRHGTIVHHAARPAASNDGGAIVASLLVAAGIAAFIMWLVSVANRNSRNAAELQATRDQTIRDWQVAIDTGNLPTVMPVGVVPLPGERFFFQQPAQYGQTYTQRVYGGGNRALYIPLGHGFRYRVGGNAGASQSVTNFMWGPFGAVYVSNRRIVFKRNDSGEIAVAPLGQILAYDCHPDGLSVQANGVGTMQFRTGDPVLGALFEKIVSYQTRVSQQSQRTSGT